MPSRRRSRERALQMIYQWEVGGGAPDKVVADFFGGLAQDGPTELDPFAESLFRQVASDCDALDAVIRRHSKRWSLERIARVLRSLLRLAIAELHAGQTPAQVVIDEALEIGKRYVGDDSTPFLNGILEAARREFEQSAGSPDGDGRSGADTRSAPARARGPAGSERRGRRPKRDAPELG